MAAEVRTEFCINTQRNRKWFSLLMLTIYFDDSMTNFANLTSGLVAVLVAGERQSKVIAFNSWNSLNVSSIWKDASSVKEHLLTNLLDLFQKLPNHLDFWSIGVTKFLQIFICVNCSMDFPLVSNFGQTCWTIWASMKVVCGSCKVYSVNINRQYSKHQSNFEVIDRCSMKNAPKASQRIKGTCNEEWSLLKILQSLCSTASSQPLETLIDKELALSKNRFGWKLI